MLNLLKNKNIGTYRTLVPLISSITGQSQNWVNEQACFDGQTLLKDNWKSTNDLREIWLNSDRGTQAEIEIYRDDRYILESLISYLFWSRDYINRIRRMMPTLQKVVSAGSYTGGIFNHLNTMVDFGGGIGLSSLHMQQLFDSMGFNIQVVYHNVPSATKQNDIALEILKGSNVKICIQDTIPEGDGFFMSEVLEHIQQPVKFIENLMSTPKKVLLHASSFSMPHQPGHFEMYDKTVLGTGEMTSGRQITKFVNNHIASYNFIRIEHVYFWNARPTLYVPRDAVHLPDNYKKNVLTLIKEKVKNGS